MPKPVIPLKTLARATLASDKEVKFNVPIVNFPKLAKIVPLVEKNERLRALWNASNVQLLDRSGFNDHGFVHVKIVANIALKIWRILHEAGVKSSAEKDYHQTEDDAAVVIFLASVLHDVGNAVARHGHEKHALLLSAPILEELLSPVYPEVGVRQTLATEILHAIYTHEEPHTPSTLEASIVRVADALDMAEGRARIPFERGTFNIHSVSALAVKRVEIHHGKHGKLVDINIALDNLAGVFQLELLKARAQHSQLLPFLNVVLLVGEKEAPRAYDLSEPVAAGHD